MHVRKWKARRFPYNPNKPKIMAFQGLAVSASHSQPHKQWKYVFREYGKREMREREQAGKTLQAGELIFSGCECKACYVYYHYIFCNNRARFDAMTGYDGSIELFVRRPNPEKQAAGAAKYFRDNRQKSMISFTGDHRPTGKVLTNR
jgi:hypothetical protein